MGTIVARKRKDGSTGYTAQVIKKKDGKVVWREAQTFDRRQAAQAWIVKREDEFSKPGGLQKLQTPNGTLSDAIDKYIASSRKTLGRTKAQVLEAIKAYDIANMDCAAIRSDHIVAFANTLSKGRKPQTVANYVSHLSAVFTIARPAWGLPLNQQAMTDAKLVMRNLGVTSHSKERDRRPSLDELDRILAHFEFRSRRRPSTAPMVSIILFAMFSTRRQEEITRLLWEDLEADHCRIKVRDMKHPGDKEGNDVWAELTPEALRIVAAMPRTSERIFPYSTDAISAAFTRACAYLEIDNLHFHDLRHDGISRLFELGRSIPQVAAVSGHRSWQSLQRYTHLRQTGDKYAGWKWLTAASGL